MLSEPDVRRHFGRTKLVAPGSISIELVREQDFILEQSAKRTVLTGTQFAMPLLDPTTWVTRDLLIRAYDLTLTEDLRLPGRNVVIACKILRLIKPIVISVSGPHGRNHPAPANDGREMGAHGSKGLDGRPGKDAGSITLVVDLIKGEGLVLEANGGNGGQGQKGGNGQKGRAGTSGADAPRNKSGSHHGQRGHDGKPGGNAGAGGAGGRAGAGGAISVFVSTPLRENQVRMWAEAGTPGRPGAPGKPGKGGDPGVGGINFKCTYERSDLGDRGHGGRGHPH